MAELPSPTSTIVPDRRLPAQILVATLGRLLINTGRRLPYPFAPALSRGLGVSLTAITSLIAINQVTGVLSPLFGPLSDRWGYRTMKLLGLGLFAAGMLLVGLVPLYLTLLIALVLVGLGKSIFDPALQAYVGERVPFQRRGLAVGLVELSWAGASLVGIPLVGLLLERFTWQTPFLVLGSLAVLSWLVLARLIPATPRGQNTTTQMVSTSPTRWRLLLNRPTALGLVVAGLLFSLANDTLFVVYGVWLEAQFNLGVAAIGLAATVIGLAELLGELLTAGLADRLGLHRSIITGAFLTALSYAILPIIGHSVSWALVGLFWVFLSFEFTIVTMISLVTEVLPEARATLLSAYFAGGGVGRVIGALLGGVLWLWAGMPAIGAASALISFVAAMVLAWSFRRS
ncbi:MAG TPA: MFS transporter [Anaerolineae bacterium]|nr:MFS transporter [Anaerolineae bacterium]HMR66496.1 MFS transporter [Anaerolineae bacterium]